MGGPGSGRKKRSVSSIQKMNKIKLTKGTGKTKIRTNYRPSGI